MAPGLLLLIGITIVSPLPLLAVFSFRERFGPGPFWLLMGAEVIMVWMAFQVDMRVDLGGGYQQNLLPPSCFFVVFSGVLVHFISDGGPRTRRLLGAIILADLWYLSTELLVRWTNHQELLSLTRTILSSVITLTLDLAILVTLFQAIYRSMPRLPLVWQITVTLLVAMWFDSLVYTTLVWAGTGRFWTMFEVDLITKSLRSLITAPLLSLYLHRYEPQALAAAASRSVWEIAAPNVERQLSVNLQQINLRLEEELAQRQRAQQALLESEERFRSLIEGALDAISIIDHEGLMQYASPGFERMLGYTAEDSLHLNGFELVHPDDQSTMEWAVQNVLTRSGSTTALPLRVQHKDGSWRTLQVNIRNMMDQPAIKGLVLNAQDITERRRLEAQLQQAQKMESIGRLAGGVAHDFNNLLTVILGCTTMALDSLPLTHSVRADLEEIQNAGERAASLTGQLLAFARRQVIEPRVFDLNELVANMYNLLRRLIGEDIELATTLAPGLPAIKADPSQIEQVIVNLVVNARDAMPQGGSLRVSTAAVIVEHEGSIEHRGIMAGQYVHLTVTDTGVGMDREVQQHIFEPFFTTKDQGRGTGLGLATCYGIVNQHKGGIWVASVPHEGTQFHVYLPIAHTSQPPAAPSLRPQLVRGTERVLLVEDEAEVRQLALRVLRSQGYDVTEAENGADALEIVQNHPPGYFHLLMTDVVMPVLRGDTLAEQLLTRDPTLKVLFVSGYADPNLISSEVLHLAAFLPKPFSPQVLTQRVREILDA